MPARCAWAFSKFRLICPGKGGIILKAAAVTDIGDRQIRLQKLPGGKKPFAGDVAADGVAGLLLKEPHEVIPAEMKTFRDPVDIQLLRKVFIDKV